MDCKLKCTCGQSSERVDLNLWNFTFTCSRCGNRVPIAVGLTNFYGLKKQASEKVFESMKRLKEVKEREVKPEKASNLVASVERAIALAGVL